MRLILFPGLAADERMYAGLGEIGVPLLTPRLPVPAVAEEMSAYARRVADSLEIGDDDLIGGCSFGSMVAAEIARQRPVSVLFLLAGAVDSSSISRPARSLERLAGILPLSWMRRFFASEANLRLFFGSDQREYFPLARRMLADTPDELLRQGARLVVGYFPDQPVPCPVAAIHGGRDRIMAPPPVENCRVIADAAHGLVMSHASEVTEMLREEVARISGKGERQV